MKNQLSRLIVIATAVVLAAIVVSDTRRFRLGPDLTGGTILVYRVADAQRVDLEEMLPALKERLDPAGLKNYVIRPLGNDRIEIVMPKAELADVDDVKMRISTVGQLEFRIVADRRRHQILMETADLKWPQRDVSAEGFFIPYGIWTPIPQAGNAAEEELAKQAADATGLKVEDNVWFRPADSINVEKVSDEKHIVKEINGRKYVLARWSPGELAFSDANMIRQDEETGEHYVLMYTDQYNVTGEYLTQVGKDLDQNNRLALRFNFNDEGATRFRNLTTEYKPEGDYRYQLGIILDGRLRSAPALNDVISSSGIISGNFTEREVSALERVLESGKLPYALDKEPIQERTIGPSLGEDTIRSGTFAIVVSFVMVVIFTLFYYHFCGVIAVTALFLNLLFTVALMVLFQATWTLPGLAGLVLTVGMAVDSNVLIFERMREELQLGRPLGLAIRAGYEKAWGTIFDSNLTTILTAVILFWIGTDQVKGFAVTLILGILTSMFSAVFVTHVIFNVLYEKRWLKKITMLQFFKNPNVDFLSWGRIGGLASILLIGAGIAAIAYRGPNTFDIDFTGGTAAGLQFNEPTTTGEVRQIASTVIKNVSVISMTLPDETPGTRFLVRTDERDEAGAGAKGESIRERLARAFEGKLVTVKVTAGEASDVPSDGAGDPRLKPFAGGKQIKITFDPPQSESFAQQVVAETMMKDKPDEDPTGKFLVVPASEPVGAGDRDHFASFLLVSRADVGAIAREVTTNLTNAPVFDPFDQFGSQVAKETQLKAIWAMILSWIGIIVYVWFRFGSWTFGIAGVVALIHDVLVALGLTAIFSLIAVNVPGADQFLFSDIKVNLDIVAALLTLIGFSINDTIVIFDRIREIKGKSPKITREMVHRSLNATLSRTIITSLTVFMVVAVLFVVGGEGLHGFAFVLVVGTITGTYSTIFIACPLLLWLEGWRDRSAPQKATAAVPATV